MSPTEYISEGLGTVRSRAASAGAAPRVAALLLGLVALGLTGDLRAEPEGLTSTAVLAARLGQVTVLDVRSSADHERAHVPGAVQVDWRPLDPTKLTAAQLGTRLGALGVASSAEVVVVGGGRATHGLDGRLVWLLDWLGHDRVSLLDGGFEKWAREGRAVQKGPVPPRGAALFGVRVRPERRVEAAEVARLRRQPGVVVLDVRSAAEYAGKTAYGAPRLGRIPGARHLDWTALLAADGTVDRSPAALARLGALGIRAATPVVVYCHSGVRAGLAVTALRALGIPHVRHYDASFEDWSRRPELPVER